MVLARGCRGCDALTQICRSTFSHKVGQNWGFVGGLRGGGIAVPLSGSIRSRGAKLTVGGEGGGRVKAPFYIINQSINLYILF